MYKILATDGMDQSGIDKLTALGYEVDVQFYEPEALGAALAGYDAVVVRSATKLRQPIIDEAAAAGRLKLIIRGGVGMDNIDVDYARGKGITVANTPAASSNAVAELALGHMFSVARYIGLANATMRQGKWDKKQYEGSELSGKTLGLIGVGRIGRALGQKAEALGMTVCCYDIIYGAQGGPAPSEAPFAFKSVDELLAASDYVSLHIPAAPKTLVDAEFLARMKDGAVLVNTARGKLIDEDALVAALNSGKLAGAALDVFAEEPCKNEKITTHPKISLTPHIAASTAEAQQRIGDEIVSIIREKLPN